MRYVKLIVVALIVSYLVFELIINLPELSLPISLQVNLPWYPLGVLTMPVWVALVMVFLCAFLLAVALEVVAWYEYTRTIHLQRKQILGLQKALEKSPAGLDAPKTS